MVEIIVLSALGVAFWIGTLVIAYGRGYLAAMDECAYPILEAWKESSARTFAALGVILGEEEKDE